MTETVKDGGQPAREAAMTEELKPCPFCGGEASMSHYRRGASQAVAGYFVECGACSANGEGFDVQGAMPDRIEYTKSLAIAAWNTRALPTVNEQLAEDEAFDNADWYWRVLDPDDAADNPSETINRGMIGNFVVCEIGCSFMGPTRYGFNAPVLDPESDEEEFLHFATEEEALSASKERYAAIKAAEGE